MSSNFDMNALHEDYVRALAEAAVEHTPNAVVAHLEDHDMIFRKHLFLSARAMEVHARLASMAIHSHQGPAKDLAKKLKDLGFEYSQKRNNHVFVSQTHDSENG